MKMVARVVAGQLLTTAIHQIVVCNKIRGTRAANRKIGMEINQFEPLGPVAIVRKITGIAWRAAAESADLAIGRVRIQTRP